MQKSLDEFKKRDTEIVAVFREEQKGVDGLKISIDKAKATFPMLLDLKSQKTKAYSQKGFATYLIGKDGKVAAIIPGTKVKRPSRKSFCKRSTS